MKMLDSADARREVCIAAALVAWAAKEMRVGQKTYEEVFELLWTLGFQDLYKLEDFRIPE